MFNDKIEIHSAWRQDVNNRIQSLENWLESHDLQTADIKSQLSRMQMHNRSEKLMVAFVAEFSRGKSELINAIFFASYGRRIMPASAGRTTMCPTELGYDEREGACLRLLPIHTRLESQPLMEWRLMPEKWTKVDLDVNDPDQLITAMNKVAETLEVTVDEARALGFWHDDAEDNPVLTQHGLVEVPKWRHALINMDHPLLRQGLIILDTPGLNAIGAEPELTMSLLPQAQAVVFILGADTGVTASDLNMWREFLAGTDANDASRFIVLNKIDTLWDELSTTQQIEEQIERQRLNSAQILGISEARVMTVSAQKGLVAKVTGDAQLLQRSQLAQLEEVLGHSIVEQRQEIMQIKLSNEVAQIAHQVQRLMAVRKSEFEEQLAEMNGLRGKNASVIRHQHMRIAKEKEVFDASVGRAHAVRVVHHKVLQQIYTLLGSNQLMKDMGYLNTALREAGLLKLGVRKSYAETFEQLHRHMKNAEVRVDEIHGIFQGMFKQLNSEFGFTLQADPPPRMAQYIKQLREIEASHEQYLGVGNMLKLSQPEFIDRLLRALLSRLRVIFEQALNEIEIWSRAVSSQIDTQLRERRRSFKRRLSTIERAESASSDLEARVQEIQQAVDEVSHEERMFSKMMEGLQSSSGLQDPVEAVLLT